MRQREVAKLQGPVEITDIVRQGLARLRQVVFLGILPYQQCQLQIRQLRQQLFMPLGGTFRAGRQITALATARVTEPHGNNGNAVFVIEGLPVHLQPVAQAVPGRVIPGNPGFMHPRARRLPHDQQPGALPGPHHRTRAQGQMGLAQSAGLYLFQ